MKCDKDRCGACVEAKSVYASEIVDIIIHCRKHNINRSANAFCIEEKPE